MQVPQVDPSIIANSDAYAFYRNEVSRITHIYNQHVMISHAKGAFAGISSLSATGVGITAAAVLLHAAKLTAGLVVLGAISTTGLGIVAITASIIWWVVITNQSDTFKVEKERELFYLHENVKRNIAKDPAFYTKHIESNSV